jgi:hypothetical protein
MPIAAAQSTGRPPTLVAVLDNIQRCDNPNWTCPLTPFENRVAEIFASHQSEFD